MNTSSASDFVEVIPSLPEDVARDCLLRVSGRRLCNLPAVCRKWASLLKTPDFYEDRKRAGYIDFLLCLVQAPPAAQPSTSRGKHPPVYGVTLYDAKLRSWDSLPPLPDFPDGLPLFCRCVSVERNLVLLGGWNPTTWEAMRRLYIFNFSTGKWRRGADMPSARSFFACGVMSGLVFIAGGHDESKNALNTADVYNLKLDQWQALPRMSRERDECKGAVVGDRFYVISGYATESQGQFVSSADVFDACTGCWGVAEDMLPIDSCSSAIVSYSGQLFAFQRHELLLYSTAEKVWNVVDTIPEPVRVAPCTSVVRDSIFITTSTQSGSSGQQVTYMYKPKLGKGAAGEWTIVEGCENLCGLCQAACAVQI